MNWRVAFPAEKIGLNMGRVPAADAARQEATAKELIERLHSTPGVILADEVGMGKTFVALAVAASVAWSRPESDPVVVMVPPSLKEKWPRDFSLFVSSCVNAGAPPLRASLATSGVALLKLLDDPPERRCHIIFLVHGALYRSLQDPWTKLAILKQALQAPELSAVRQALARFAQDILRTPNAESDPALIRELLEAPTSQWRDIRARHHADPGDEPVPAAIDDALASGACDLSALTRALRAVPLKSSQYIDERLADARRDLAGAFEGVWQEALRRLQFRSPLLILDEAHHVKNAGTRLASLFIEPDAEKESALLKGALASCFERMLFLTATPFQLGHRELLSVLERFSCIRWEPGNPVMTKDEFVTTLGKLGEALDTYQLASARLDRAWSKLKAEDVGARDDAAVSEWWSRAVSDPGSFPERARDAVRAWESAREAMLLAEGALRPWIIRHLKPRRLPRNTAGRRKVVLGAGILDHGGSAETGLRVTDEALLPFLLAARTQTVLERERRREGLSRQGASTFAEGLASSYEAFLETRSNAMARRPSADLQDDSDLAPDTPLRGTLGEEGRWYVDALTQALPGDALRGQHPKIHATVEKVFRLWEGAEKVVVFCHWRATGQALRLHLSRRIQQWVREEAAYAFECKSLDEVDVRLEAVRKSFSSDRPAGRHLEAVVNAMLDENGGLDARSRSSVIEVVRKFVREDSFLVRYFALEQEGSLEGLDAALDKRDRSGLSLREKLSTFVRWIARSRTAEEREAHLAALATISSATRADSAEGGAWVPNVRLASGAVDADVRRNLLLAFNTPFFPEILIASSVMAEGVDLHLACRHLIHHDLSWNPSTLEQRNGRIDRLGCKAETVEQSIEVYLPYVEATQDEKMFRVVRDRERWFTVLLGEGETGPPTGRVEDRVPLPREAVEALTFNLGVVP